MKKRMAGLLALLFVTITAATGCSQTNTVDSAAEAMNIDGVSVSLGELNFYLRYQQVQMQSVYGMYFGEDFMNQDLMGTGSVYGESVRDTSLDVLKEYYIVEAHAEELGVALTEEEKTAASDAAKAFIAANDSRTLELMSADEATVTHVLELMALRADVYDYLAGTIDTEVDPDEIAQKRISYVMNSTAGISDADGNVTELTEDELSEKYSVMESILAEAEESGDLNAAAEAQGLSATSTTYGKNDTYPDEAVLRAADALADGEFSGIIQTENGYYIVYMESTLDEDATESERQSVLAEREQDAYDAWYNALEEASEVTTNEDAIQTLTFERIYQAPTEE